MCCPNFAGFKQPISDTSVKDGSDSEIASGAAVVMTFCPLREHVRREIIIVLVAGDGSCFSAIKVIRHILRNVPGDRGHFVPYAPPTEIKLLFLTASGMSPSIVFSIGDFEDQKKGPIFRPSATVSRIGLMESRLHRHWCGGPLPTPLAG